MLINSALVRKEIFINREGNFDGSVFHDFSLNGFNAGIDSVGIRGEMFVLFVFSGVARVTFFFASGGGDFLRAGSVFSRNMMVAGFQGISLAVGVVSVKISSDNSGRFVPIPSRTGITTITTHTARSAAGNHILGRNSSLIFLSRSDTDSIRHSFNGTESPAGTTVSLISDFLDGVTFGPSFSGIEVSGDIIGNFDLLDGEFSFVFRVLDDTHLFHDGFFSHIVPSFVVAGFPGGFF